MTLYLTDNMRPAEVFRAADSGVVFAAKLYPAGATTHSDSGVTRVKNIYPVLEAMQECDLPLLVHAEVTDPEVDIFDHAILHGFVSADLVVQLTFHEREGTRA